MYLPRLLLFLDWKVKLVNQCMGYFMVQEEAQLPA